MKVAVVGGGAAGFFAAINIRENHPGAEVHLFEKSQKLLTKVKISGGGRCNLTHASTSIQELAAAYPRGGKALKKAFSVFGIKDTVHWFESRGVPLMTQDDQRMFPESQDSQTIINLFLLQARELGIQVKRGWGVAEITTTDDQLCLSFMDRELAPRHFDKIVIASGGSPQRAGLDWLEKLGHQIEEPVPSLFTFNLPTDPITTLPGISVDQASISIQGTKLKSQGPLLITHWGLSGPAVLRLSALGARHLHQEDYSGVVLINWANENNQNLVGETLYQVIDQHPGKHLSNRRPFGLPERLWRHLLEKCEIDPGKQWREVGKKSINKLVNILTNDRYQVSGKTTFKEEFVTCGGISLSDVDIQTMESKVCKNMYFAGEVLDIDGITGGFNFQAAWTTAFIAAKLASTQQGN